MSVTIMWRPTSEKAQHFHNGTSDQLSLLQSFFGKTIKPVDIRALRAMNHAAKSEFYGEVADIVEQVGEIEIWGQW